MKIQVPEAVAAEAGGWAGPPAPPIECVTAKIIATAVVNMLAASRATGSEHLRQFVARGDVAAHKLHVEIAEAYNALKLDPDDLPLTNALIGYFEWCGDREGGSAWRSV